MVAETKRNPPITPESFSRRARAGAQCRSEYSSRGARSPRAPPVNPTESPDPTMRKLTSALLLATLALGVWSPLTAQTPAPKAPAKKGSAMSSGSWSPHLTTSAKIDDNRVVLIYGSPNLKDPKKDGAVRKVWGGLVPFGKIWRLGSDEATLLITQKDIDLGGTTLPGGAYSLYLQPEADGSAKLVVNKAVGQWGVDPYPTATEFARIALKKTELKDTVEQFTMAVKRAPSGGGVLSLAWENLEYSAPYALKK